MLRDRKNAARGTADAFPAAKGRDPPLRPVRARRHREDGHRCTIAGSRPFSRARLMVNAEEMPKRTRKTRPPKVSSRPAWLDRMRRPDPSLSALRRGRTPGQTTSAMGGVGHFDHEQPPKAPSPDSVRGQVANGNAGVTQLRVRYSLLPELRLRRARGTSGSPDGTMRSGSQARPIHRHTRVFLGPCIRLSLRERDGPEGPTLLT
ncbi:hypothetical protein HPB51_014026 [Rhipicephalus microplus]|uniref:Uncharacterized protein n=1 Tax=Rhipicephalus microplus TaxID=6941 RepID=A0A9J6DA87_RHIMP|nr:hypothetical protein HPB51_014026 [Rhipicephalus microplus]